MVNIVRVLRFNDILIDVYTQHVGIHSIGLMSDEIQ